MAGGIPRNDALQYLIDRGQGRYASIADRTTATAASTIKESLDASLRNVSNRRQAITRGSDLPPARPAIPGTAQRIISEVENGPQVLRQNTIRPAGLGDNIDVRG